MQSKSNPDKNKPSSEHPVLITLLFIIGFTLLLFVLRFSRIAFLILLMVLLLAILSVYIYRRQKHRVQRKRFAQSATGKIQIQMEQCLLNIEQLENEMGDIRSNIHDLKTKIGNAKDASQNTLQESERLLAAFDTELKLRAQKIEFYQSCLLKLKTLANNHQLIKELEEKHLRLVELKESQYEELATMEELRSNLEYEEQYLDTIESLSLRMLHSQSTEKAEALQSELQQMTLDLRK